MKKSDQIKIEILNWGIFNPRKDLKATTWFRLQNSIFDDPQFFEFTHAEICVWLYLLSTASKKQSGTVSLYYSHAERIGRFTRGDIDSAVKKLEELQCITVVSRTRNVDDTRTSRSRTTTNERTNERNERNETNGGDEHAHVTPTERDEPASQDALPGIVSEEPSPKGTPESRVIAEYHVLWKHRHGGRAPVMPKDRGLLSAATKELGEGRMLQLIRAYFAMPDAWCVSKRHDVTTFHSNLTKIAAFADTGEFMTSTQTRQLDRTATNASLIERIRRGEV